MKRRIIGTLTLCLAVLLLTAGLTGCVGKSLPEGLIGEWTCEKFASDGTTATDFYALYIEKNGKFSLYDTVGNPGISGKMTLKSTEEDAVMGTVTVSCNSDDFDPPLCWDMQESDEWELLQSGDGAVNFTTEMLEDEDVGIWRIYDFYAEKAGNVLVTMNYRNKDTVMYTVSFDLAVNDNGTIHENGIGGDVDDAMTS